MLRTTALCFALLASTLASCKGRSWSYVLTGIAYDAISKDVLRDTPLLIGSQVITTDSTGHYRLTISGTTCDRGTRWRISACNERAFGKLVIRRIYSTASITINSRWKQFAFCQSSIVPCTEQRRDLYVPA
ncbi:MAG: hypothetical protein JNM62_13830 [Flavobacteriales bacterium]|nr:hypothetical protein [Flavobacteriales bacterium]